MTSIKRFVNVKTVLLVLLVLVLTVAGCKKADEPGQEKKPADSKDTNSKDTNSENVGGNSSEGLIPIDIKLPNPMYEGTPVDNRVPNLEKPLGRPRDPFLAPAGTVNVAAGKPVSGSDEQPIIGDLEMITDGDKEGADGSFVELSFDPQYITIDLEAEYKIYAILCWHFHKAALVYYDVIVEVSNDPDFIESTILFNNDTDNSSRKGIGKDMHYIESSEGKLFDAKGVEARYVRLYSNGNTSNDFNHYIEVEVYGKPAK